MPIRIVTESLIRRLFLPAFCAMTLSSGVIKFSVRSDSALVLNTKANPAVFRGSALHHLPTVFAQALSGSLLHEPLPTMFSTREMCQIGSKETLAGEAKAQ
jgi:hypothetical protein